MEKEYTISLVEDKNKDWKIVTLEVVEGDGSVMYEDVSVNRVNKKGEIFPNFDNIKVGERVKGNLWSSSAGKRYLFAPSPIKTQGGANKASGGYKTQVIKEAQETKHWLRMLLTCFPERREEITRLWKEAQELTMIFQKITSSLKK